MYMFLGEKYFMNGKELEYQWNKKQDRQIILRLFS